jgi:ATP-binding cassette subfamily F protein 3
MKVPEGELRSLLGSFLFRGDDVFKQLGVLSGGERNRFALARILVSPSNFLLLDEPTNHLDMRTKDVLLDALAAFSGTVVFVSHDRYFIDRLATRVLEVEGGKVTSHEGNYEDYLRWKSLGLGLADGGPLVEIAGKVKASEPVAKNGNDAEAETAKERPRRLNPIKQKQMEERCAYLEEETPRVEASIRHTEEQLGVYVSSAETQRLTALAEELRQQLAALTEEWEELMVQLDEQGAFS